MRALNNEKGVVTIFLLLIFMGIFMFSALLVEGIRMRNAKAILDRASDTAIRSTLAGYNSDLKEEYGLFAYETSELQEKTESYLIANLAFNHQSSWNLYDFQVDKVTPIAKHSLDDVNVFERQVLEYMKYRGLISASEEVFGKIQAAMRTSKTAKVLKKDIEVDEKVEDVGKLVKAVKKGVEGHNSYYKSNVSKIRIRIEKYHVFLRDVETIVAEIKVLEQEYSRLIITPPKDRSEKQKESIKECKDDITDKYDLINTKKKELGFKAPKDIETAIAQQKNSVSLIISKARKLKSALSECDKALENAKQELKITKNAIEEVKSDLTKKYDKYDEVIKPQALESVINSAKWDLEVLDDLKSVIEKPNKSLSNAYKGIEYDVEFVETFIPEGISEVEKIDIDFDTIKTVVENLEAIFSPTLITDTPISDHGGEKSLPSEHVDSVSENKGTSEGSSTGYMGFGGIGELTKQLNNSGKIAENRDRAKGLLDDQAEGADSNIANDFCNGSSFTQLGVEARNAMIVNEYIIMMLNNRVVSVKDSSYLQQTEVEYVIMGKDDPKDNANLVRLGIIGMRFIPNFVSVSKDAATLGLIEPIAASVGGATGGLGYLPAKYGMLLLIASLESGMDSYQLCDGYKIPFFKGSSDTIIGSGGTTLIEILAERLQNADLEVSKEDLGKWKNDASNLFNNSTSQELIERGKTEKPLIEKPKVEKIKLDKSQLSLDKKNKIDLGKDQTPAETKTSVGSMIQVDYEDHLRIMLMMMDCTGGKPDKLNRVQDVIQMNLAQKNASYGLTDYATYVDLNVNASIKSIFFSGTFFNSKNDPENAQYYKDRREIKSHIMHGY